MHELKQILLFILEERVYFGIALLILVATRLSMVYVRHLRRLKKLGKVELIAAQMRLKEQDQNTVRVRQTDLIENMDRSAKMVHRQAEMLEQEGRHREAASLFESINFQRRAIDILEKNGFIKEACEILVRLNSTNRAAIICERNQMDELAAHYYALANMDEKAGSALLRLAGKDYHYYEKAAVFFEKSQQTLGLLKCWGPLLQSQKILQLCLETSHYDFLIHYMRDPVNARSIIPLLSDDQLGEIFKEIAFSPETIQTVINWVYYVPDQRLYRLALKFGGRDVFMCRLFWQMASEDLSKKLFAQLLEIYEDLEPENIQNHLAFFESSHQLDRATILADKTLDPIRAVKNLLKTGNILQCYHVLNHHGKKELATHLGAILQKQPKGPWSLEDLAKAKYYIELEETKNAPLDVTRAPHAA